MQSSWWRSAAIAMFVTYAARAAAGAPPEARPATSDEGKAAGDRAFDVKQYKEAVLAYTRAYETTRDPALLYNRGRAYEASFRYARALQDFEAFQREAPPALVAKVPALDALVTQTRTHVCRIVVTTNVNGARVTVGDEEVGRAPLGEIPVDAGPAAVRVEAEGYLPFEVTLSLAGGRTQTIGAVLVPKPAPPAPSEPPRSPPLAPSEPARPAPSLALADVPTPSPSLPPVFFASAGASLVALVVAGTARIAEEVQINAENIAIAAHDRPAALSSQAQARTSENVAIVGAVVGGLLLGTTVYLWFRGPQRSGGPAVGVGVAPQGLRIAGSF